MPLIFSLPDLEGTPHALSDYRGRVVVVNFWSAECPWAERADTQLKQWLAGWGDRVVLLTVASNVNETLELIAEAARQRGLAPVLLDSGCRVADAWGAQTTPHVFVVDEFWHPALPGRGERCHLPPARAEALLRQGSGGCAAEPAACPRSHRRLLTAAR